MAISSAKTSGIFKAAMLLLFVCSLIAATMPDLIVLLMFTGIGLPLGLLILIAPPAFTVLLTLTLIYWWIPGKSTKRFFIASVLTLAVLAIPSVALNVFVKQRATSWTLGDLDKIDGPLRPSSIATENRSQIERYFTQCDAFCLHALLTGATQRFLVMSDRKLGHPPIGSEPALEFSIQRRDVCPEVRFKYVSGELHLPQASRGEVNPNAIELMQLRIADGECLIQREATLKDAEVIITDGRLAKRDREAGGKRFEIPSFTSGATRRSVYQQKEDGSFEEIYRRTSVQYWYFGPLLLPVMESAGELRTKLNFWRHKGILNGNDRFEESYSDWGRFLTDTLGLPLQLNEAYAGTAVVERMEEALNKGEPPSVAEWMAFRSYVDRKLSSQRDVPEAIYQVSLRLTQDLRYPPPPQLGAIVRQASSKDKKDDLRLLSRAIVERAETGVLWSENTEENIRTHWDSIGSAFRATPKDVLEPYKRELLALVRDPDAQAYGRGALSHLSVFGADAVPDLLYLVEIGLRGGNEMFASRQFEQPYLAGMSGLCKTGNQARSALPKLRLWWQQGLLPSQGSPGRLAISTLAGLGVTADELWPRYVQDLPGVPRSNLELSMIRRIGDCD